MRSRELGIFVEHAQLERILEIDPATVSYVGGKVIRIHVHVLVIACVFLPPLLLQ